MTHKRPRLLALLAVFTGLLLVAYGYAVRETTLVVRTDLGPEPAEPAAVDEPVPEEVTLADEDDWDDEGDDLSLDEDAEPADDDWDGEEDGLTKELEAAAKRTREPLEETTVAVRDGGLIRGAAMGIIVRLPDGRLALTWVGGGRAPTCFT